MRCGCRTRTEPVAASLLEDRGRIGVFEQGIGRRLVTSGTEVARARGMHWLHVDYAPHLDGFYRTCGFQPTLAGLIALAG